MMSHSSTDGRQVRARRRGYVLTAGVLLVMMLGGTLPIPLYVLYEKQMGFGPLGVTVVFVAYVLGTLLVLVALGDLSDHVGRRKVLALAVLGAVISSGLFLAASSIGLLIVARVVSGMAAGFATGTATAALAELQPRGDHQAAAVVASGSNMTGLGLGPLVAGLFAEYAAMPTHSVFWAYLGACALALAALAAIPETVRHPDGVISLRPRLAVPPGMRTVMLGACLGVFAAFSVLGLFSSLVPTFLHNVSTSRLWWRRSSCWPSSSSCAPSERLPRPGRLARHRTAGAVPRRQPRPDRPTGPYASRRWDGLQAGTHPARE